VRGVYVLAPPDIPSRQAVFYSVGHTGVIFDYEVRQQRLLQVCVCVRARAAGECECVRLLCTMKCGSSVSRSAPIGFRSLN
jgi:hypothetical protein